MVSYDKLRKYILECWRQFMFAKFHLVSLKTQGVQKTPHVKFENIVLSTAVVDALIL